MEKLPLPALEVLDLIRVTETSRDDETAYDTIYGHHENELTQPITTMTVEELQANQPGFSETWGSSASGAYQIMFATLGDLIEAGACELDELFDADLQDDLGFVLLQRRGYDEWAAFTTDTDAFMIGLAKEWASFPVPYDMAGAHQWVYRGQSYYAGDSVNRALITPEEVWTICENARNGREQEPRVRDHREPAGDRMPLRKPERIEPRPREDDAA